MSISFSKGFTTITGETGAGKSIMLGALGLVLGKRADSSVLMNQDKKCVIEAEFHIQDYQLESFFKENDLDYEAHTIIRRELLSSGKSRAFINDTPVRLSLLNNLQNSLIDIHSQHQTLQLNDQNFQFALIDALAGTTALTKQFLDKRKKFNRLQAELEQLSIQSQQDKNQEDYNLFLLRELEEANFQLAEQEELEEKQKQYSNGELIQQNLNEAFQIVSNDELGVVNQMHKIIFNLDKIKSFSKQYDELYRRLESSYIDLKDIESELENILESILFDPSDLDRINNRLQLLYDLYKKHKVVSMDELLKVKDELAEKVENTSNAEEHLSLKKQEIEKERKTLIALGKKISNQRKKTIPELEKDLVYVLNELGIPEARFEIKLDSTNQFFDNGTDQIAWLFSANKGSRLGSLKQVASGGELSRIMLAVKSILALHSKLPTILFDEIDTGVSGEIALKMGAIMKRMSKKMQVISITHLPQIAAKGIEQMKVYKYSQEQQTHTGIKRLNIEERIQEIAEMLGGKNITDTAQKHALQLLQ